MKFAAAVLALCAVCGSVRAQGDVRASLDADPPNAAIGEPITWTLRVDAPRASAIQIPDKDPLPDASWVLLAPRTLERTLVGERLITLVRWSVMSLESGERALPAIEIEVGEGAQKHKLAASAGKLQIATELEAHEDVARAPKGFATAREASPLRRSWGWIVVGALLAGSVALLVRHIRRRKPVRVPVPSALQRLSELESGTSSAQAAPRETVYALSQLLRASVDRWTNSERVGLIDEDWARLIAADERVPLGVKSATARILAASERIKYGGERPTRFAVEELLRDARAVLETLEREPLPAPASAPVEVAA